MAQVVIQLEFFIFFPIPKSHAQNRAQIEGRYCFGIFAPLVQQLADVIWSRSGRGRVDVEPRDVHRLVAGFHPQKRGVSWTEGLHGLFQNGQRLQRIESIVIQGPGARNRVLNPA